jgi:formamidopyrimidine-DNA glycosylase
MPELPEIQALVERLDAALAAATLSAITPLQFSALKTYEPRPESLIGSTLEAVGRRGKHLVFDFGSRRVVLHLSQGGRVDLEHPPKHTRPKGAVLRLSLRGRPSLLVKEFGTQRKASWWVLGPHDEGPLARLGPEPFSPEFERLLLGGRDRRRLHSMLRDQRTVAGIGRGFADDILHAARLSPFAALASLEDHERRRLLDTVHATLSSALERERRRTGGLPPKLGDRFAVHGRAGHPCPRCGADLRRVAYDDYEIAYCPVCQTGGKVLADRRMSRLVK